MYIVIIFLATLAFIFFWQKERDKAEQKRFREFVIANKSDNLNDYTTALPADEPIKEIPQDEYVDVTDIDPDTLLNAMKS